MYIVAILLIISSLVYFLMTNNERQTLAIFCVSSLILMIFGYGIPIAFTSVFANFTQLGHVFYALAIFIAVITIIKKIENSVFMKDYSLILRSFYFKYETIAVALYLVGLVISSGYIIIDFLMLVAIVRLFKIDTFIGYSIVSAVMFTNGLFVYSEPAINALLSQGEIIPSGLYGQLIVLIIPLIMTLMYFVGFGVRSFEKKIKIDFKILLIILITAVIGALAQGNYTTHELLNFMPFLPLILLYLNDMNIRKDFSRYSAIPLAYSIVLIFSFLLAIYFSFSNIIIAILLLVIINIIVSREENIVYKSSYVEWEIDNKQIIIGVSMLALMILIANNSVYNSTQIGHSYIDYAITNNLTLNLNAFNRTFVLYLNSSFYPLDLLSLVSEQNIASIQYFVVAIPALFVLSIPFQLITILSTGYKSKVVGEMIVAVIGLGLVFTIIISYVIGV